MNKYPSKSKVDPEVVSTLDIPQVSARLHRVVRRELTESEGEEVSRLVTGDMSDEDLVVYYKALDNLRDNGLYKAAPNERQRAEAARLMCHIRYEMGERDGMSLEAVFADLVAEGLVVSNKEVPQVLESVSADALELDPMTAT